MAGVVLGVVAGAAVGNDHGSVVSVDPEARRGAAWRHDDKHRDVQLYCMVSHGHGEVTISGNDHALPLLSLGGQKHVDMYSYVICMYTQPTSTDLVEVNEESPHSVN